MVLYAVAVVVAVVVGCGMICFLQQRVLVPVLFFNTNYQNHTVGSSLFDARTGTSAFRAWSLYSYVQS